MIDLEQKLIEYFTKSNKKISLNDLIEKLKLDENEKNCLVKVLQNLEIQGIIYTDKHDLYTLFPDNLIQDRLKIDKKGRYFVSQNNICTYIDSKYLNGALVNDLIVVKKLDYKIQSKQYGIVNKIVSRANDNLLFEYSYLNGQYFFKPIGFDIDFDMTFDKNKYNFPVGTRVSVSISKKAKNNKFCAKINNIIGHKDDPDCYIKMKAICNGFDIEFSVQTKEEVKKIPSFVKTEDLENRIDLRDKQIFTIDGSDTKDMDDAISLNVNDQGNYVLGVHIADVAHYVKPNSHLFNDAYKRGTSLYLAGSVIPMLPHELSNGICSLNEGVDRLTKTCLIEISPSGKVIKYAIFDSVINSKKKMTYEEVNSILDKGNSVKGYNEFIDTLFKMRNLSNVLSTIKKDRGYIRFKDEDIIFKTDENGSVVDIKGRNRGTSEEMIENFMVLANEMVASTYPTLPFVYRVHPSPSLTSIKEIIQYIKTLNVNFRIPSNISSSKSIQGLLNKAVNFDTYDIISDAILRAMKKASYSADNIGHFGLALSNYTHFTSPIRRFPDLMVHTLINKYNSDFNVDELNDLYDYLSNACKNSSLKERQADVTEREVCKYKIAEYMETKIGEEYEAYIYNVSSNHITVKLDNLIIGKINVDEIDGNPYYEPSTNAIITDSNVYKIGRKINVIVKSSNKETGVIKFKLKKQKVKSKI